jgi:hypothetical protein
VSPKSSVFGSGGLEPRVERLDLLPTPGCQWEIEPRPFRSKATWHAANLERAFGGDSTIDPVNGGLRLLLVQATVEGVGPIKVRPVFFDENANRVMFESRHLCGSSNPRGTFTIEEFLVDPRLAPRPSEIRYFGLERVVPESARLASQAAQTEAKARGLHILPPPRLGETYGFDLPTADGKSTRTDDFRGKFLVVAVWGPRHSSTASLFFLKSALKAAKPDEVAVVGVSFDGSIDDARETFAGLDRDDPLVVIPNEAITRRIWSEGAEIAQVPTFFLLDRDGKLRFVCNTLKLRDSLALLIGRPKLKSLLHGKPSGPRLLNPPTRQSP